MEKGVVETGQGIQGEFAERKSISAEMSDYENTIRSHVLRSEKG